MGASSSGECSSTYYISLRHVRTFLWDPGLMYVVGRGSCVCVNCPHAYFIPLYSYVFLFRV